MRARPIGRMISGPGPGMGPNKGAPNTKIQPIESIVHRKAFVSRQDMRLDAVIRADVGDMESSGKSWTRIFAMNAPICSALSCNRAVILRA